MMLKLLFAFILALVLVVSVVTGCQKSSGGTAVTGKDLVVTSLFGQKLDPVIRFPDGSHPQSIYYLDQAGKYGNTNEPVVIYYVTSPWKIDDLITFYRARYPGQSKNSVPYSGNWSIGIRKGSSYPFTFIVPDPQTPVGNHASSYSEKHGPFRTIACYANLPNASVDQTKSANNGVLVFPIPQ